MYIIKLLIDQKKFSYKPSSKEIGSISNRLIQNPVDVEPSQFANEIIQGKSFVPAYITTKANGLITRTQDCWTSQQVICIDFDNGYYDRTLKQKVKDVHITWEEAQEEFKTSAIFMYKTFSHTDDWPKFSVVFAYNEPFTDINLLNAHTDQLLKSIHMLMNQPSKLKGYSLVGLTSMYLIMKIDFRLIMTYLSKGDIMTSITIVII
ncbi:hypothetical protein Q0F98_05715 [Paenibacillus amylolyticus]|nr:hypothetical protein Q0F98_05715 [Paenibacillus amylolyticus]